MAEAEEAWRKAEEEEAARKEAEKQKKAKALVAQHKQLEPLSQQKVTMQIAQEEDAQRASETSGAVLQCGIMGYRKGKVLEKHVCTNCLRKGIEWDKGGQGKSEKLFFF